MCARGGGLLCLGAMTQDGVVGFRFRRPTPVVGVTLIALVVIWIAMAIAVRFVPGGRGIEDALVLDPVRVLHGRYLWTMVTAALLHSLEDTDHLVFNALAFYFFAPDLEELWGRRRFVIFMAIAALGGNAFVVLQALLGLGAHPVLGFSGVVLGVITAFGLTFPTREIWFFFFRLRGLHLVYITLALQLLGALSQSRVSSAAHLGGMAVGAVFVSLRGGPIRAWWLRRKLARLAAERDALRGEGAGRRRAGGPELRVIQGGADKPRDKRYLN